MFLYLKSLELQGFKSFPDKIKLDFGKGLTAVVGPNGSGKSNIGDAVRWVLGEQSTKTLRGSKMEDVIFAGTQKRKSVGFAQVTLNIDNSSRTLDVENDIVSVSRKLYRNGDSEYMINGKIVRLKDVVELFMDTGLGRDGYSIIGQGRVAEIVSNKSDERRQIFEEAAGISKIRYKKEESQKKLSAAEENLIRLRDIVTELEDRVGPLKLQSEKAKKFITLSEEQKNLEITLWVKKLDELKVNLSAFDDKCLMKTAEYENLENELDDIDKSVEDFYKSMQSTSVKIEKLRTEILDTEKNKANVIADIAVLNNDIEHLNTDIKNILAKQSESENEKNNINLQIENENSNIKNYENSINELTEEIKSTEQRLGNLALKTDEYNKNYQSLNEQLNNLYIQKSQLEFSITSDNKLSEESKDGIEKALQMQSDANENLEKYQSDAKETKKALIGIEEHILEHNNKINGFSKLILSKEEKLSQFKSQLSSNQIKLSELTSKKKILEDLENNLEGFGYSVKEVIKSGISGRISGVFGTVAQLIKVDSKYSLAIETALGGALQNVIVKDEDTAKRCIRLLKENRLGRATFLPVTSVKGYSLNENNLDLQDGFIDYANKIVKYNSQFSGIINYLLGRIVIAENIDCATNIAKKYSYKFRIVTLDGQIINAGGSFTGGSASKSTGVLTRKNEIEKVNCEIDNLSKSCNEYKDKLTVYQAEYDKLVCDCEAQKDALATVNTDKVRFEYELNHLNLMLSQMELSVGEGDEHIKSLQDKNTVLENNIVRNKELLEKCCEDIQSKETVFKSNQDLKQNYSDDKEKLASEISLLRLKKLETEKDKQACENKIIQLQANIENNNTGIKQELERLENCKVSIQNKKTEIDEKQQYLDNTESANEQINDKINNLQKEHTEYEKNANEKRAYQKIKSDEKEVISREIAKVTEQKLSVQKDYDSIISQLWEQYQMTRSQASEIIIEISDYAQAKKQLTDIKTKIRSLGTVNVDAIEEYKEVSERYEFMTSQIEDVEKSKKELENLISELTSNMKTMFTESFNIINENFKKIFVELFGGGKAELVLTEPENVLESGIEIIVAPPGKVIKNLSLLSGGEQAFIAIAIYFSILKLRPSPFCVLDEIEAALDDVNVSKYANYLRNFTDTTQFIVITHRRGTMEEADVLYGVTMQEKGISKLLKMDTKETVNIAN